MALAVQKPELPSPQLLHQMAGQIGGIQLSRKKGDSVVFVNGEPLEVKVLEIRGDLVKLGVEAKPGILVYRAINDLVENNEPVKTKVGGMYVTSRKANEQLFIVCSDRINGIVLFKVQILDKDSLQVSVTPRGDTVPILWSGDRSVGIHRLEVWKVILKMQKRTEQDERDTERIRKPVLPDEMLDITTWSPYFENIPAEKM